ncbi:hypothetical protein N9L08_01810 [Rhodobacteraceae bacterium]|nr:hypothetical protein [Paracoccaceae bacterium]
MSLLRPEHQNPAWWYEVGHCRADIRKIYFIPQKCGGFLIATT